MHMAALRHLADDVRERFARLRTRHTDDSSKAKRRTKVISTDGAVGNGGDRIETPDLIRPHVDVAGRTASLPPLPPTPPSSAAAERSRRRRRTSAYLCPSSSAIVMGHIYEEIPSTTPPPQRHRCSSPTSGVEVGRVFYVSPLDGALCRIFPVNDRALHGRQLACPHVQRRPSDDVGHPASIDVVGIASSGLSAVRGRELRLCVACYRQLRSSLAADETTARDCRQHLQGTAVSPSVSSSSLYNSCDLSLLNVPSCYSPEAGYVDDDVDNESSKTDALRFTDTNTKSAPPIRDNGPRDSLPGDVIGDVTADVEPTRTPKFGESGSAFTKFDGGRRAGVDDGPSRHPTYDEDGSRQRPRRVVTDPSFDVRRRPLRDADDALLAVLDSTPDGGLRSEHADDLLRRRINCAKSTSCADVRWARRRSLAIRRRSDDDDDGRRTRVAPATSTSGRRRASACCGGSETALHGQPTVKSVYYNGLLASMIDLTAAFDRASTDDRLSCRATSGPRRSLRSSRQSPPSPGLRQSDQFTIATVHHSSGDLRLRSVQ